MKDVIQFDQIDEHGPRSYSATFDIPAAELERVELSSIAKVHIEARADKGDAPEEYAVDGSVNFTADFNCSRCVDPYPVASASNFHIRFRPRPEALAEGDEVEITEADELDVEFYSGREVRLRDLVVEQVQLSIPMKPLCQDSCLGLCPQCGANLNHEKCDCESSLVDPRWGSLQELRDQLPKKRDV